MNFYLIGIIFFIIILIVCIILFIYFKNDENKLLEVSNDKLVKLGKSYSKEELENKFFEMYSNVLLNVQYENYSYLKDIVSDNIYNEILLKIKEDNEKGYTSVISNIQKDSVDLVYFDVQNGLEIAKVLVKYSNIEYVKGIRDSVDEMGNSIKEEVIISGNTNNKVAHSYILTFVKSRTETEDIVCPNCGYQTHMLASSKCIRCDSEIVPKKMHWVYVGKEKFNYK